MDIGKRIRCLAVVGLLLGASSSGPLGADVLVLKSGRRYEGKVVEQGDTYVLTKPGGGRMALPKSIVAKVILSGEFAAEFGGMCKSADLTKDEDVDKLIGLARKNGLVKEVDVLLADAQAVRASKAADPVASLYALARLAKKHGLSRHEAASRLAADRLAFGAKLAAAGGNGVALAKLAAWCRQCGLAAEAKRAEAEAIRVAPDDVTVRAMLGYVKSDRGTWIKDPFGVQPEPPRVGPLPKKSRVFWTAPAGAWPKLPRRIGLLCRTESETLGRLKPDDGRAVAQKWLTARISPSTLPATAAMISLLRERMGQCGFKTVVVPVPSAGTVSDHLKACPGADVYLVTAADWSTLSSSIAANGRLLNASVSAAPDVSFVLFARGMKVLAVGNDSDYKDIASRVVDGTKVEFDKKEFIAASSEMAMSAVDKGLLARLQGTWMATDIRRRVAQAGKAPRKAGRLIFQGSRKADSSHGSPPLRITNKGGHRVLVSLVGPVCRRFTIAPAASLTTKVPAGTYDLGAIADSPAAESAFVGRRPLKQNQTYRLDLTLK